jgi:predicted site-specific integrase-resolvase
VKLTISEAARRAGVERPTLYRKIKAGELSKEVGEDGKPAIELSELARLYPNVIERVLKHDPVSQNTNSNSLLQAEVQHLREQVAALQQDKERLWEQLQAQTRLLSDQRPAVPQGFLARLFGKG